MPAHLGDLVQGLGQELLVDATEVGHLHLALMVHVHATVWGGREAEPSGSPPGRQPAGSKKTVPLSQAQPRAGRDGGESRREEGFWPRLLGFLPLEKDVSEAITSTSNLSLFKEEKEKTNVWDKLGKSLFLQPSLVSVKPEVGEGLLGARAELM